MLPVGEAQIDPFRDSSPEYNFTFVDARQPLVVSWLIPPSGSFYSSAWTCVTIVSEESWLLIVARSHALTYCDLDARTRLSRQLFMSEGSLK